MFFIPCVKWKTLFLIKDNCYPEVLFNHYFLVFFKQVLRKKYLFYFYLHNTNSKIKAQCEHQSSRMKLSHVKLSYYNFLNYFYFLMHHIFLHERKVFKILKVFFFWHKSMFLQIGFSTNKIRDKLLFKKLCKSYKNFLKITSNSEENKIFRKKTWSILNFWFMKKYVVHQKIKVVQKIIIWTFDM